MAKHVKMPCGWGCGALLKSTEMRSHFLSCPNRPKPGQEHVTEKKPDPKQWTAPSQQQERVREIAAAEPQEPQAVPLPSPVADRVAGLRSLLGAIERRTGVVPGVELTGPEDVRSGIALNRERCAAVADLIGADLAPTPFDRSNNRRAWSEKFAQLRRLGQFDEAGAGEGFAELVRGHQLPGGFGRWSDAKKIEWLSENLPLEEE